MTRNLTSLTARRNAGETCQNGLLSSASSGHNTGAMPPPQSLSGPPRGWRKPAIIAAALFLLAVTAAPVSIQAEPESSCSTLPPDAITQLSAFANALAKCHIESTVQRSGNAANAYAGPSTYSTYFEDGRFYQQREDKLPSDGLFEKSITWRHEDSFDKTNFYFGDPERSEGDNPATLARYQADDDTDPDHSMLMVQTPYLDAAGLHVPESIADFNQDPHGRLVEPMPLRYLKESKSTKIVEDGKLLRVTVQIPDRVLLAAQKTDLEKRKNQLLSGRNSSQAVAKEIETLKNMQQAVPLRVITFVLDPAYGYGVVDREEQTASGQRIAHFHSDKWKFYQDAGAWLPGRCVAAYYTNPYGLAEFSDEPISTITCQLKQADFKRDAKVPFTLAYDKPGTLIRDRSTPEARRASDHQVSYTVAVNGALLRGAAANVASEIRRPGVAHFWTVLNVLLLGLVMTVLYFKNRPDSPKGQ